MDTQVDEIGMGHGDTLPYWPPDLHYLRDLADLPARVLQGQRQTGRAPRTCPARVRHRL
ncbi:hypothetical protein AA0614_1490 [Komagataeibacter saccharivorans NRIC 0614]|nr:hypothetical protein AA0614_1490 [Komagataeibacter saccharivorans NRIC 0614]